MSDTTPTPDAEGTMCIEIMMEEIIDNVIDRIVDIRNGKRSTTDMIMFDTQKKQICVETGLIDPGYAVPVMLLDVLAKEIETNIEMRICEKIGQAMPRYNCNLVCRRPREAL